MINLVVNKVLMATVSSMMGKGILLYKRERMKAKRGQNSILVTDIPAIVIISHNYNRLWIMQMNVIIINKYI